MTAETHDVLIVGGGPAGAALATELARAGRDVVVVERELGPHDKVCGEFLSGEALDMLERLGIDVAALGAVPICAVGVSRGSWRTERPLPFRAMSLSRRVLDEALLTLAGDSGARALRGSAVRELRTAEEGWRARLACGRTIVARHAVLATGKHDLRGHARPPGRQNDLIGFKTVFRLPDAARRALEDGVEIGLFPGGYAGLEPIEGGRANLCLVVTMRAFAELGGGWDALAAHLRASVARFEAALAGAEPLFERPLAVSRIPYGLVRRGGEGDGLWRVGDQAAVVPSFAGEGVTLALHGARLAARGLLDGRAAGAFQATLATDLAPQIRFATALSRMIVHPAGQALAPLAAPTLLRWLAGATRLRPRGDGPSPRLVACRPRAGLGHSGETAGAVRWPIAQESGKR
ncbi:NAD(P)/FAD-dependent oxidoreductase [Hansschlegelia sp. KR7-227]|uniref:NAD(P)/FAD-dependent oxidoreductase n=1 Tax=Hansschlegelia sp. KR7-227 TaxID=3400914 RepID=UPI003C082EEA